MCFVKICQQCGKEFTTKRYPTQFCSPRCCNQHRRTEKNKRKLQLIKQYDRERNFVRKLFDWHLFFHSLYELHRGAVVVFAGELAEADVGNAEFASDEDGGGVGTGAVVLEVVLEPFYHPGFGGCAEFLLKGFHEGFFGHA